MTAGPALRAVVVLCSAYVLFAAFGGFLVGQVFFGLFSVFATLAGIGGTVAAGCAMSALSGSRFAAAVSCASALIALVGVGGNAADYYLHVRSPGNYYAWPLIGPFCAALAFLAWFGRRVAMTKRPDRPKAADGA